MSKNCGLVYVGSPHFDGVGLLNTEAQKLQNFLNITILDGIVIGKYPEIKNFSLASVFIWKCIRRRQFLGALDKRFTKYLKIVDVLSDKIESKSDLLLEILNEAISDHCVCNNITDLRVVRYRDRHLRRQYNFICRVHGGLVELFRKQKFSKVIIFNGRNTVSKVLALVAKEEGVPVQWIEYFGKRDHQMTYAVLPIHIFDLDAISDYFLGLYNSCQDPNKELVAQQCLEDRVANGDQLLLNWRVKVGRESQYKTNNCKKTVVFFFSSEDEYPGFKKSACGFAIPYNQYNIFFEICEKIIEAGLENEYRYIVKLHPRYEVETVKFKHARSLWDDALSRAKHLGFNFETVSPLDCAYSVIKNADLVFSFGSTAWEATYLGKPAVLLGPVCFSSHDCAYIAYSVEDVIKYLQRIPEPKPVKNCFPFAWAFRELGHVAPKYELLDDKIVPSILRNIISNRFSKNDYVK